VLAPEAVVAAEFLSRLPVAVDDALAAGFGGIDPAAE